MMSGSAEDLEEIQLYQSQEEEQEYHHDDAIISGTHRARNDSSYGEEDEWEVLSSEDQLEDSMIVVNPVDGLSSSSTRILMFGSNDGHSSSILNESSPTVARSATTATCNSIPNNSHSIPSHTLDGTEQQPSQEQQNWNMTPPNKNVNTTRTQHPIEILSSHDDDDTSSHVVIPTPEEISLSTEDFEMSHVLVSPIPLLSPGSIRRVSSFKDAILFQLENKGEQVDKQHHQQQHAEKFMLKPRTKPKFVVSPIRRCSKSTGDLQSLDACIIEDDGGGEEDEILGASDAMEYYHQKNQGFLHRKNGKKILPDEAKRKEMTMQKKNLQRQQQREREHCGGRQQKA
jgi:hypothetical protein